MVTLKKSDGICQCPISGPNFDPDVFVSYSHGHLIEGRAPLRDRTLSLIRRLRYLLSLETEFDDLISGWTLRSIRPPSDRRVEGKGGPCGVLMIVMSNRYLKSSWCKDELEWFKQQVQDRAGASGRVFVLRAQKTDTALWPDFCATRAATR